MTRTAAAADTGLPTARRAFLGQLATLPLIGGAVTLIGQPTGVAELITENLMQEYRDWLAWEHRRICVEIYGLEHGPSAEGMACFVSNAYRWHRGDRRKDVWSSPEPSTRAALVLSAVGCDWRTSDQFADVLHQSASRLVQA